MTLELTGVAPVKPPVPQTNRTGCIADFMGGYYGFYGIEYEPGNPERFFKRVNVVHGDNPTEILATSREEQVWQAHPDWTAPSGESYQSNFSAAVTVREGLVAYVTNTQAGYGTVVGSLRWDGSDVHWGPETLVVDEDSLPETEIAVGRQRVGYSYIKFPGNPSGEQAEVIALGAYQGRVLYVGGGRSYSTSRQYLVMRWFRFDADGRAVPDGDWIYKLNAKVNYGTGYTGGPSGVQGKFLYISSTYNASEWHVARIDMETMALTEVKVADTPNSWEAVTMGASPAGVEMPTDGYVDYWDRPRGEGWSTRISPHMKVTRRDIRDGYRGLYKKFPWVDIETGATQFIPQTAILRPRRDMLRMSYLPPVGPNYEPLQQGWLFHTLDGKEYVEWRGSEYFGGVGVMQLYIGTTHALATAYSDNKNVIFIKYPAQSDLAAGEMRSEGFFA